VSFTKSAVTEAKGRAAVIVGETPLPYFRTLHSLGWQLLGRPAKVGAADALEMKQTWGYQISFGDGAADPGTDTGRIQRWHLLRNLSRSLPEALERLAAEHGQTRLLVERYERHRSEAARIDFTDMLMLGMEREMPRLEVLYIDEAQDLCPLQIEFAERLARSAAEAVIAGDDDQAIMRFQGASPEWFQGMATVGSPLVLPQSYRIPAAVHVVAESVIGRVAHRVPKAYAPRSALGEVTACESASEAVRLAADELREGRTVAYLGRTNSECSDAVEWALGHRVPFIAHAGEGRHPLQSPKVLEACRGAVAVRSSSACTGSELVALLDQVEKPPRGCKAEAKRLRDDEQIDTLRASMLGLGLLWRTIRESEGRFDALAKVSDEVRAYLDAVLDPEGRVPEKVLVIGTQHWSKGQEWDTVVVDDMLPRPSVDALHRGGVEADDEHRIAYVAVTRCRQKLVILSKATRSRGAGRYAGRYPFPVAA